MKKNKRFYSVFFIFDLEYVFDLAAGNIMKCVYVRILGLSKYIL